MQNYRNSVWSIWNKCRESIRTTMNPILNILHSKISSTGRRTRRYFDPLFTTYFDQRRIIQDKLDRLSNNSSMGYAIVAMVNFVAMFLKSAVVVECVYHFRPYYWMLVKLFIYLFYDIGRKTTTVFAVMGAILKFIVIMTFRLTSTIFVWLATMVVYAFSRFVPNALLALNGVFRASKLLITPVTSPAIILRNDWKFVLQLCFLCSVIALLMLLWRRRVASSSDTSSKEGEYQKLTGCFLFTQNFWKFRSKVKKKCSFRYDLTGIFGTTY